MTDQGRVMCSHVPSSGSICWTWLFTGVYKAASAVRCLGAALLQAVLCCRYYLWRTGRMDGERLDRTCRNLLTYLGYDGLLILRLIELNHGTAILTLIVDKLSEFHDLLEVTGRPEEGVYTASSYLSLSTTRLLSYSGQRNIVADVCNVSPEGQPAWPERSRCDLTRSRSDLGVPAAGDDSPDSGRLAAPRKAGPAARSSAGRGFSKKKHFMFFR